MNLEPTSWNPDRDRASRLCDEARKHEDAGARKEAERLYREAISLDPDNFIPRLLLGSLLGEVPSGRRAGIRELQRALELNPEIPCALVSLGNLLMNDGRCTEAEPVLKHALDLEPRPWTCVYLGACMATLGRSDEAVTHYRRALDLDPEYEEAEYCLGRRLRFNDPTAAERHLRRAIELDPVYALAWGELGHVLLVQGRVGEAIEVLEHSVPLNPAHVWNQLRLAVSLVRVDRVSEADKHLRRALQLRYTDETGEYRECLKSDLAAERPDLWSRLYRAYLLGRQFDFDESLKLLEGASDDSPLQTLRRALLADQALWKVWDGGFHRAEAVKLMEFALDQEPDHPEAWEVLGQARYKQALRIAMGSRASEQRLEVVLTQARKALEKAISLAPDRPFAHLYLGVTYKKGGRQRLAEYEMRRAVELGADGVYSAVLGDHLADLGRFTGAETVFRQALEDYPECAMAWRDYGRTLIRDTRSKGYLNLQQAVEAFERAVELGPENPANHYYLADALTCLHADHLPRAKGHLERCLELRPDHRKAGAVLKKVERLLREAGEEEE